MSRFSVVAALLLLVTTPALAGGTLTRAAGGEPQTLDPQQTTSGLEIAIESDLFEGLTTHGPDGAVLPGVAERWESSADGKSWTFHLRADARWSNGMPVTAEDFVYALHRELDPQTHSPMAGQLAFISGAEALMAGKPATLDVVAIDPHTLHLGLTRPWPFLAEIMSYPFAMPLYRPDVEADPVGWSKSPNLVSNGPFTLAERVPQVSILLRRNPAFHDADKVALDQVRWRVLENDATAFKSYRIGEADIAPVTEEDLEPARNTLGSDLHVVPIFGTELLVFNLRRQPLGSNLALRRALAMALDRDVLAAAIAPGVSLGACSFVPEHSPGYRPAQAENCTDPPSVRMAAARALAASAGVSPDNPLKLEMVYRTSRIDRKRLSALVDMWKPLGIELTLVNREWRIYLDSVMSGKFDVTIIKIVGATSDPLDFLSGIRPHGDINLGGYDDPAFEALMHQAEDEPTVATRNALLNQAEQKLLDSVAIIPVDTPVERIMVSPRVHGWQNNPFVVHPSRFLSIGP